MLLLVFCVAEIHELIPGLHTTSDDPRYTCPFCLIKYILSFSVLFATIFLLLPENTPPVFIVAQPLFARFLAYSGLARSPPGLFIPKFS